MVLDQPVAACRQNFTKQTNADSSVWFVYAVAPAISGLIETLRAAQKNKPRRIRAGFA